MNEEEVGQWGILECRKKYKSASTHGLLFETSSARWFLSSMVQVLAIPLESFGDAKCTREAKFEAHRTWMYNSCYVNPLFALFSSPRKKEKSN